MGADVPDIAQSEFGSTEYAKEILGALWGQPAYLDLEAEWQLHKCLAELSEQGLIASACDVSDGGIAVAVAQACFGHSIGATIGIVPEDGVPVAVGLFGEPATRVILTCHPSAKEKIEELVFSYPELSCWLIGETVADHLTISQADSTSAAPVHLLSCSLAELRRPWVAALESALHEEVLA